MIYHIIKHLVIGVTLFLLIYDRKIILLINKIKLPEIYNHMMSIVKEIFHIRKKAKLMI